MPRFAFEKFPDTDATLTTQMKSVGEAMAIGRTFREALQKAVRSLETGHYGFDEPYSGVGLDELKRRIAVPTSERLYQVAEALRRGLSVDEAHAITWIDRWFL